MLDKQPSPAVPHAPPMAIVLIFTPQTGQIQIQWPPQMPVQAVRSILHDSLATIDNMVAAQNGGIIKASGPLPPSI